MERYVVGYRQYFETFLRDRFIHYSGVVIFLISLTISIFFGFLNGLIVVSSYLAGLAVFHALLRYIKNLWNFIIKRFSKNFNLADSIADLINGFTKPKPIESAEKTECSVCRDSNCNRENIIHNKKPWAGLMIPKEIDAAIQSFLEKTMEEYIQSWYKKITIDSTFPTEIRINIRYAASILLSKLLKVNIGSFISYKLIPLFVRHLEILKEKEKIVFHPAVYNRKTELNYLRTKVKLMLPVIFEQRNIQSGIFASIVTEVLAGWVFLPLASTADPIVINNLLLILLGNQQLTAYPENSENFVEFLKEFSNNETGLESNNWALHPDLCNILKDQSLLYAFMQFLKDQGAVHILQFCLDVEEFNKRMLNPELSTEELDCLHRDAWDLYSVYFSPHSPDNIGFTTELITQMRKVLSKDVTKLRTSRPLFEAYEHAYSLLDKNYCPQFHCSDEFYTWLCGPRSPTSLNISGSSSPSLPGSPAKYRLKKNEGTVSNLSRKLHRIKGALRSNTVLDGHAYDTEALQLEQDTEFGEDLVLMAEEEQRDLSSWKVEIDNVDNKLDPSSGKFAPTYTIHIKRITNNGVYGNWRVERRLADFYALENKLTEFHGDFPDSQLPPCGLLAPSPPTEAYVYESYLQKLLTNPSLRGSDLLFYFLTSSEDFMVEDNAFGKFFRKSVPISLRKERGQNIESFITTFFSSTETKAKNKTEYKEGSHDLTPRKIRCITNTVFCDNLGISLNKFPTVKPEIYVPHLSGPSDCLILFGVKVLKVPKILEKLALAIHSLLNRPIDILFTYYISKKLKSLLVPQRIAHIINLLESVVFEKQSKPNPKILADAVSDKIKNLKGLTFSLYQTIFLATQNPILNKQLLYTIFDVILEELFPEAVS